MARKSVLTIDTSKPDRGTGRAPGRGHPAIMNRLTVRTIPQEGGCGQGAQLHKGEAHRCLLASEDHCYAGWRFAGAGKALWNPNHHAARAAGSLIKAALNARTGPRTPRRTSGTARPSASQTARSAGRNITDGPSRLTLPECAPDFRGRRKPFPSRDRRDADIRP